MPTACNGTPRPSMYPCITATFLGKIAKGIAVFFPVTHYFIQNK